MRFQDVYNNKIGKTIALTLILSFAVDFVFPTVAYALTSGPTQPEVQKFTPVSTSDMVNLFTGDFNYNIPLINVGGYPINLSYDGGNRMEDEASWVGLGWNINPGVINRNMRGVPDDFNGDQIRKQFNSKPNITGGVMFGLGFEFAGLSPAGKFQLSPSVTTTYNNYTGYGFAIGLNASLTSSKFSASRLTAGLGLNASSESGLSISPTVSFSQRTEETEASAKRNELSIGFNYNNISGLQGLSLDMRRTDVGLVWNARTRATGDNAAGGAGSHIGLTYSFASPSYTPSFTNAQASVGLSFQFSVGAGVFWAHPKLRGSMFYSQQFVYNKDEKMPAFGYLYSENVGRGDRALMDFNREKDGAVGPHTSGLPVTTLTHDIYSVAGQGIGGTYRPFRNDIGTVHDPFSNTSPVDGVSLDVGLEIGGGNVAHVGGNVFADLTFSQSGEWDAGNETKEILKFHKQAPTTTPEYVLQEKFYFKQAGEINVDKNSDRFTALGEEKAVAVMLTGSDEYPIASASMMDKNEKDIGTLTSDITHQTSRVIRQQGIQVLTGEEASLYGASWIIPAHKMGSFDLSSSGQYWPDNGYSRKEINVNGEKKDISKHVSEVTAFRKDGARYIYGIPAYNLVNKEVSFALNDNPSYKEHEESVHYDKSDASVDNKKGLDHFFSSTELPPFAHSYLLTQILSDDYEDTDGISGPSDGDYGTYTKFNYSKVEGFKWRAPFDGANFNEGYFSNNDDKGSYVYGEKDIWYLHSIETKTHVAEFELGDRNDGRGVSGEHEGTMGGTKLKKLKEIRLYSKSEKMKLGANAVPITTVHFDYDYELCPGVLNNKDKGNEKASKTGKLTLKRVYFTYGKSKKGKLNKYEFAYAHNPEYNSKALDKWGMYMPPPYVEIDGRKEVEINSLEPYAIQDKELADEYASSWNLSSITTPSGAVIQMEYEADDYSHVQHKRAMEMIRPEGMGTSTTMGDDHSNIYGSNYVYFKLKDKIEGDDLNKASEMVREMYGRDEYGDLDLDDSRGGLMEHLYFKYKMNLNSGYKDEYVAGFVEVEDMGACPSTDGFEYGWVKVRMGNVDDKNGDPINPMSKWCFQFIRKTFPRLVVDKTGQGPENDPNPMNILKTIANSVSTLIPDGGPESSLKKSEHGKSFDPARSYIRLYSPRNKKLGGGYRVKSIKMRDAWNSMTGGNDLVVGQYYEYEKEDGSSSGVAGYEPMAGGDENPWRQPEFKDQKVRWGTDITHLAIKPYGESMFPAPQVGYSKVTVRNVEPDGVRTKSAQGKIVHEFYTAKDYPTQVEKTGLVNKSYAPKIGLSFLKIVQNNALAQTQGFVVRLNDMHGKQKAVSKYDYGNEEFPVTSVKYHYKTKGKYNENVANELDNKVKVIHKNKKGENFIENDVLMGVDYDMVADTRFSESTTVTPGALINAEVAIFGIFPIPMMTVWPQLSAGTSHYRSITLTKVVNKYGLLEKSEVINNGARIVKSNKLYDAETGDVVLTEENNHFEDPVYKFNYPAYWTEERMGGVYKNMGASMVYNQYSEDLDKVFVKNDEVAIIDEETGTNYGIRKIRKVTSSTIDFYARKEEDELPTDTDLLLTVVRPGRRNLLDRLAGTVVTKENPISGGGLSFNKVLAASSITYADSLLTECPCNLIPLPPPPAPAGAPAPSDIGPDIIIPEPEGDCFENLKGHKINVLINNQGDVIGPNAEVAANWARVSEEKGGYGTWKERTVYDYQTTRQLSEDIDLRNDGTYNSFPPYWIPPSGSGDWTKIETGWSFNEQISKLGPYGTDIESRDMLDRYSSVRLGFNNTVPICIAGNAKYREIGFDGFEDAEKGMRGLNFNIKKSDYYYVSEEEAHTGNSSLKVLASGRPSNQQANQPNKVTYWYDCVVDGLLRDYRPCFNPILGKEYLISAWVKAPVSNTPSIDSKASIEVSIGGVTHIFKPSGPVIDGWQKIEGRFQVGESLVCPQPDNVNAVAEILPLVVSLVNSPPAGIIVNGGTATSGEAIYFDDIRIHPVNATFQSFVYDPVSLRLWTVLDDNNYATFYEYDEEGNLVRTKKETERGIFTLQENRSSTPKKY